MAKAPAAQLEINRIAETLASRFGGRVAKPEIKSEGRIFKKAMMDYGADASRVTDIARNTIVVDQEHIAAVSDALLRQGAKVKVVDPNVDPFGYSGVNAKLKTSSGLTAEIQVNTPQMIFAKETEPVARGILGDDVYDGLRSASAKPGGRGHELYEKARSLPIDSPEYRDIPRESRAYYDGFR